MLREEVGRLRQENEKIVIWEVTLEEKEKELERSWEVIHKLKCIIAIHEYIQDWKQFINQENAEEISIGKLWEIWVVSKELYKNINAIEKELKNFFHIPG